VLATTTPIAVVVRRRRRSVRVGRIMQRVVGTLAGMEPGSAQAFDRDGNRGAATTVVDAQGCTPAALWRLLATPRQWPRWAPHIRRATPWGAPADVPLHPGDRVRIDGWGPVHVTAAITRVDPDRRWDFLVELPLGHRVHAIHEVLPDTPAVRLHMTLDGAAGRVAGDALLAAYQPLAGLALRRLVTIARATST
jgi:uncharacterized protein YndB with AHSA1/START domain